MNEKNQKLVSVIIPAYNVENFIDRCLDSLINQSYTNWEAIVVDDGSTDTTWQCIEAYSKIDSRIRPFRKANTGVSKARNFALRKVNGEYIQFLDADDCLKEDSISTAINALQNTGSDWVSFQYESFTEDNSPLKEYNFISGQISLNDSNQCFLFIVNTLLDYDVGYEIWSKLYKTSIIEDNNLRFLEDCKVGEDLAFNIGYAMHAKSINCISDRLYLYRQRIDSVMAQHTSFKQIIKERYQLVKELRNYFAGQYEDRFYQIFYKLMFSVSIGHTAVETLDAIDDLDEFYVKWLEESLKHQSEFYGFYISEKAMLYYRYGLYIKTRLTRDYVGGIRLFLYDIYRKMRKLPTIEEWIMI